MTRENSVFVWAFLAMTAFVSGCAKEAEVSPDDRQSVAPLALAFPIERPIVGPLEEAVNRLQQSKYLENCDHASKANALEITRALDSRTEEIKAFAKTIPAEADYKKIKVGPAMFKTATAPETLTPGWRVFDLPSWSWAAEYYSKIKNHPVDAEWIYLNARVRYLLSNDENRLIYGGNMQLDKDSGALIQGILKALASKDFDLYALEKNFTLAENAFLKANANYTWFLKEIERSGFPLDRQKALVRFASRLESDYNRYEFRVNPSVVRLSRKTLVVPMDPGVFTKARTRLATIIEDVWRSTGMRVRINWMKAKDPYSVFKVLFDPTPGGRAYVSWGNWSMNLFQDIKTKTIAHEFGHVLGFKDRYYDIWYPNECLYREQIRDEELMSASHRGGIVAENWHELDTAYPMKRFTFGVPVLR